MGKDGSIRESPCALGASNKILLEERLRAGDSSCHQEEDTNVSNSRINDDEYSLSSVRSQSPGGVSPRSPRHTSWSTPTSIGKRFSLRTLSNSKKQADDESSPVIYLELNKRNALGQTCLHMIASNRSEDNRADDRLLCLRHVMETTVGGPVDVNATDSKSRTPVSLCLSPSLCICLFLSLSLALVRWFWSSYCYSQLRTISAGGRNPPSH